MPERILLYVSEGTIFSTTPLFFADTASTKCCLSCSHISDPARVVRVALENTVSVASVLLLVEATLTEIPEPKRDSIGATAGEPAY